MSYGECMIATNAIRAEIIAREIPDIAEVQAELWCHASRLTPRLVLGIERIR